jgi:hypothetical protein
VAILVTGAKFRAAYAIYAHVNVAEQRGLSDDKLATIVAGQRPGAVRYADDGMSRAIASGDSGAAVSLGPPVPGV